MRLRGSWVLVLLGIARWAQGAEKVCTKDGSCTELDRERAYSHFLVGNDMYNAGDLKSAVAEYRVALKFDPQHADTLCNMGSALQDLGELEESVELYLRAVDANPYHATAHFNLAILLHDEDLDTAIEHYQAAIEADPTMADAWANLGSAMHQLQEYENAVTCYQEAIGIYESDEAGMGLNAQFLPALHFQLGTALASLPDDACVDGTCTEHAVEQLRRALRLDPENVRAQHSLGVLMADPAMKEASNEYVKRLFDDYAATFDDSLAGLKYQAPELLREVVGEVDTRDRFDVVFDAGCGTGLCGPLFEDVAGKLIGVDLSPKMIDVAHERAVYHELVAGDIREEMVRRAAAGEQADLILAADVLVYMGALEGVMESAAVYCRPGGLFAFTLEKLDDPCGYDDLYLDTEDGETEDTEDTEGFGSSGMTRSRGAVARRAAVAAAAAANSEKESSEFADSEDDDEEGGPAPAPRAKECTGWTVTPSGRFAHTREYVVGLAKDVGFGVRQHEEISPRFEGGKPVWGHLFVLERLRSRA